VKVVVETIQELELESMELLGWMEFLGLMELLGLME
jgi:hypothetical protein